MALEYNVSQLLKSDVGQTRVYEFATDEPMDIGDGVATGVHGSVKFTLTNFGVIAHVDAQANLHLTCARCLEPFQTQADVHFEEEYRPTVDVATGQPVTSPGGESASSIAQNHTIDLTEAIRENLVLAVEIIPVCSPDCRGLCPTCGANLNAGACDCAPAETDSPFAGLKGLLANTNTDEK